MQSLHEAGAKSGIFNQAFMWMFVGLALTGASASFVASNQRIANDLYSSFTPFIILAVIELGLVIYLSARITKMSYGSALTGYLIYSLINGLTMGSIFLYYTTSSVAAAFFTTALTFGVMALYGYRTKRDLTSAGSIGLMLLIGLIIAYLINLWLKSDTLTYVLSFISIGIFTVLTAYDAQKIKRLEYESDNQNLGILGALTIYLDFINIFLDMLRFFGKRRRD
jgi:hypothetical protein